MTKVRLYALGTSTTLESNKSVLEMAKLAPILKEIAKNVRVGSDDGSGRDDGKLHATSLLLDSGVLCSNMVRESHLII